MNKFNSKITDKIRHFINKIGNGYKVLEIKAVNPYEDIIEMEVILNKPFDYSNVKLRKKEFIFSSKLHKKHNVYLDFDVYDK